MTAAQPRARPALATSVAAAVLCVGVVGVTMSPWAPLVKPLAGVLTFCALVAELLGARYAAQLRLSAAFVAGMLAVGFLGPVPAFLIPVISYVAVWVVDRYRWRALLINLASSATPTFLAAVVFQAVDPPTKSAEFILLLAAVATGTMALNYVIAPVLFALLDGQPILRTIRGASTTFPAVLLNVALLAVVAGIYAELGLLALVFVLLNVIAFTYMARLVITAR